ncbi:MAG: LytTR family DNA-binding domain-containing protein [Gemmatimonadaceae bacterium]|nr:LytTR family DNA-binding domain-containing protein [Gemmatimonadaceae bacterium]
MSPSSTPWRVVAIDDEPPALKAFARLFDGVTDFQLVATSSDPFDGEGIVREVEPAVVFLDVRMPGRTGFDVARALGPEPPLVVFVTAYDQFAIQAFEAAAVDYLLKPVDPARFAATLTRLRTLLRDREARDYGPRLTALLERVASSAVPTASSPAGPPRVGFKQGSTTSFVDPRQIERIDADDNDILVSIGTQRLRVRETLTAVLERLPREVMLRVSRSCAVNRARVQRVEPYFHGDVVLHLANGTSVTSGRTYRRAVREALGLGPAAGDSDD